MTNYVTQTLDHIAKTIDVSQIKLSEGYSYNSIVFCVIDAVYSIGVRYTSTEKTVLRYCSKYGLKPYPQPGSFPGDIKTEHTIRDFMEIVKGLSFDQIAASIFENKQRTSARSGILKAHAVYEFASVLYKHGINSFEDIPKLHTNPQIGEEIKQIKGQGSGISLNYFYMLTGSEDYIKPDRHIYNFIFEATGDRKAEKHAEAIIAGCVEILKESWPDVSCRSLDHAIWRYMSVRVYEGRKNR